MGKIKGYKITFVRVDGQMKIRLIAFTGEDKGLSKGFGYGVISKDVIDEAVKRGVLESGIKHSYLGSKEVNIFYKTNDFKTMSSYYPTDKRKLRNLCLVTHGCYEVGKDGMKYAFTIMDKNIGLVNYLNEKSLSLSNKKGRKFTYGRHDIKVHKKSTKKEECFIGIVHSFYNNGLVFGNLEGHHKYSLFDYRKDSTEMLTEAQHHAVHYVNGRKKKNDVHRLEVEIRTIEELELFLDFMNSVEYKNLFK